MAAVMLMNAFFRCLRQMSPQAYAMALGTLRVCCTMVFCAFMLLVHRENTAGDTRLLLLTATELYRAPLGIILLGVIFSPILEERSRR